MSKLKTRNFGDVIRAKLAVNTELAKAVEEESKIKKCNCCDEPPVVRILTMTDGEGILLDKIYFCDNCWQNREIGIHDKEISY